MNNINEAADYVLKFINQTDKPVFLTGRAGTGKTTLLKEIIRSTHKNTVVVAPTGIAALNAGGVTIHSLFQLPFAAFLPEEYNPGFETTRFETPNSLKRHFRISGQKKAVIRNMQLLVIDEVSMLRPDLLDAIDLMLRTIRKNNDHFGGVQVLFIGDLLQLPPVVKNDEWRVLSKFYSGKYFFHARVTVNNAPVYIELSKIYRQTDTEFISVLNNLRTNRITPFDRDYLNQFVKNDFDFKSDHGCIVLTTHNAKADEINNSSLNNLSSDGHRFRADVTGDFPEHIYPVDEILHLKEGAQVMFIKNDTSPEKQFFNGKTGIIKLLSDAEVIVEFPEEKRSIEVDKYEWKNIRYSVDKQTGEISEEVVGTFVQYPLKLAWAITVHKSQGLSFDKAAIDVSQVFMPGQAYVALSRLRSPQGLVLLSPLKMNGPESDDDVVQFSARQPHVEQLEQELEKGTITFIHSRIRAAFDLRELSAAWREHLNSRISSSKSSKKGYNEWASSVVTAITALMEPANKFLVQIDQQFATEKPDLAFITGRIHSAFDYFFPKLDAIKQSLTGRIDEFAKAKKSKGILEDLKNIEEEHVAKILQMMSAKLLINAVRENMPLTKEKLISGQMREYRRNKNTTEDPASDREQNNSVVKSKKNTVTETYELWIEGKSIKEIAEIRKLTRQTICTHFSKLIKDGKVSIDRILSSEKQDALEIAFEGYQEESLSPLKEKYGNEFTWDELKLYSAHLNRANKQPLPQE